MAIGATLTPYITPELLDQFPLGISWSNVPDPKSSDAQKYAAKTEICQMATGRVDAKCNQVLRATQNQELLFGPDWRVTCQSNGLTRLLLSQWPILQVTGIRCAPANTFPQQWVTVASGSWWIERPPLLIYGSSAANDAGTGGQAVLLGGGYASWAFGRNSQAIETTYIAGWPHAGITANASVGDEVLQVDDCTGWAPATAGALGVSGVIHDVAGNQEAITCTASSAVTGPGTLTLGTSLQFGHDAGILVSSLPDQAMWATAKFAAAIALTRGATATTIHSVSPKSQDTMSGHKKLEAEACEHLRTFSRVI
jgi:hypothetical protein